MLYADEILDYSGQRKTGVTAGSYGPSADVSPEAGGTITVPQLTVNEKGLITDAVERTVTLPSGGGGGSGSEWAWDSTPAQTITLENAWYDDTEDGPYGYEINITGQPKAVFVDIQPTTATLPTTGTLYAQVTLSGMEGYPVFGVTVDKPLASNDNCTARIMFLPEHGIYAGYGSAPNGTVGISGQLCYAFPYTMSDTARVPIFADESTYISAVTLFPSSNMLPAGTIISIYAPAA